MFVRTLPTKNLRIRTPECLSGAIFWRLFCRSTLCLLYMWTGTEHALTKRQWKFTVCMSECADWMWGKLGKRCSASSSVCQLLGGSGGGGGGGIVLHPLVALLPPPWIRMAHSGGETNDLGIGNCWDAVEKNCRITLITLVPTWTLKHTHSDTLTRFAHNSFVWLHMHNVFIEIKLTYKELSIHIHKPPHTHKHSDPAKIYRKTTQTLVAVQCTHIECKRERERAKENMTTTTPNEEVKHLQNRNGAFDNVYCLYIYIYMSVCM